MATNKIGIGIDAQINTANVEAGLKRIQHQFEKTGKTKIEPISDKAITNADKLFQQLKRVDTELRRRAKATGQGDASFENFNFESAYPNAGNRAAKLRTVYNYVGAGAPPGAGGGGHSGGGFGGMAMGAAQAGLRAAGPAGGVAANALGTGMASGAGAGLMGLMGGMLALGVGKLVSGVMDKVDQAKQNEMAYDKLKRTLGDVSVSFNGLKAAVVGTSKSLSITYDETAKLGLQFAKAANISGDDYKTLPGELRNGVGLSRAFGLDPSEGVGVLGKMRGLGVTKDVQDSRRFALLIGETIGKSGAFAKADEVMSAMADYATQQTRSSLGGANVAGYAGMFSSMVGSGIPGLDPAGASGLLSKINGILAGGGGKGEASQFFTGQVGSRMGLDPFQTQVMREHGAFATNNDSFKKGTPYELYMGKEGPKGSSTFLQETRAELERQFPSNSDYDKRMRAMSFANHATGGNINQAMGMLALTPDKMGELSDFAGKDLSKLSTSGLSNLIAARSGTAGQRQDLSKGYLARTGADAISGPERDAINAAMGDDKELKNVLGKIALKYDQEKNSGTDIRDSKNILDNIAVSMAGRLVPLTQDIRHGIMALAGQNGKYSPRQIMESVLQSEADDKKLGLGDKSKVTEARLKAIQKEKEDLIAKGRTQYGAFTDLKGQEELQRQLKVLSEKEIAATDANNAAKEAYTEAMKKIAQELEDNVNDLRKGFAPGTTGAARAASSSASTATAGVSPFGKKFANDPEFQALIAANEKEILAPKGLLWAQLQQESGFNPNAVGTSGEQGMAQFMPATRAGLEKRLGRSLNPFDPKDAAVLQKEYMKEKFAKHGNWHDALRGYNGSLGLSQTENYANSVEAIQARNNRNGTPTPGGGGGANGLGGGTFNLTAPPVVFEFRNPPKEMIMPQQGLQFKVSPPSPRLGGGN